MPDCSKSTFKFVILAAPRSGSNLLCTMLHSHPDVLCHHEVFNPEGIYVAVPLRNSDFNLGTIDARNAHPEQFLASIWSNNLGHSHVGFKMTHKQHLLAFKQVCGDSSIHKIVLKRRNPIAVYVSRLIAEQTGIWEDYRTEKVSTVESVTVDAEALIEAIRYNKNYYAELDNNLVGKVSYIAYEDLFNPDAQSQLQNELGLTQYALKASSRKQNPYSLSALIANFNSLKAQLSRNPETRSLITELDT